MNGSFDGIDAEGEVCQWEASEMGRPSWKNRNIKIYENQPVLRSAPNLDGRDNVWYVPTVVKCNRSFGFRNGNKKEMSLRSLYERSKKTCQYCFRKIPFCEATKDHIYPKHRGGTNQDHNIVLACKSCNNKKGSIFPFLNCKGEEVKPIKTLPSGTYLPPNDCIREEWKKHLYLV